jgi:acetaldehyde dehydrogenase (acetylating)
MLASFDERMLRDIGLTRGDLNDALSEPLWRDPTAVLVRRQRERRVVRVTNAVIDLLPGCAGPSIVPLADARTVAHQDQRPLTS